MTERLPPRSRPAALLLMALLTGCALTPTDRTQTPPEMAPGELIALPLFTAEDALETPWRKVVVWSDSEFTLVPDGEAVAIRAETDGASAALVREVDIDAQSCPEVAWSWRVDEMPREADLASRQREDVAASILLAFGDPGSLTNPDQVPTLRYAWATETNPVEQIIDSPYFPGILRTLVVRSGREDLGVWVEERRNLLADYQRAFGELPENPIEVFAVFTDSDHDNGPSVAQYRWAEALCTELPEPESIF